MFIYQNVRSRLNFFTNSVEPICTGTAPWLQGRREGWWARPQSATRPEWRGRDEGHVGAAELGQYVLPQRCGAGARAYEAVRGVFCGVLGFRATAI